MGSTTPVHMRLGAPGDAEAILAWRNDPATRSASLHGDVVSLETHVRWYSGVLGDPLRVLLVGERAGTPIGMCRFDLAAESPDRAEVSINLAPEWRGRGLGGTVLDAGIEALRASHPGVLTLTAVIRADNLASVRLFESSGFRRVAEDDGVLSYERRVDG